MSRPEGDPERTPGASGLREFLRGAVRLHVLHHAAEGGVHGAWMAQELAHHGYRISPGTLYPTLHRMADEGLLSVDPVVVNGRSRRVYRITDAGLAALAEAREAVRELAAEVLPRDAAAAAGEDDGGLTSGNEPEFGPVAESGEPPAPAPSGPADRSGV